MPWFLGCISNGKRYLVRLSSSNLKLFDLTESGSDFEVRKLTDWVRAWAFGIWMAISFRSSDGDSEVR